jgi:hypothetical protein
MIHPSYSMGKAVSPPGGRMVPGDEEPTLVNTERDVDRGQNFHWDKICNASIDEETGIVDESRDPFSGGAAAGIMMVLGLVGESRLGSEEGRLKADGVQEGGAKDAPLLAPGGHVSNEFTLVEEGRRATVGILEPM